MSPSGDGRFDEPRYRERLDAAEAAAAMYLASWDLDGAWVDPWTGTSADRSAHGRDEQARWRDELAAVDVPAVRIVLLRRVAESDLGGPASSHAVLRAAIARRGDPVDASSLAVELALCRLAMDQGYGVSLGWLRLGLLDPALDALDGLAPAAVTDELLNEVRLLCDLLATETMTMDVGSTDRRFRLVGFLAADRGGALPAVAFDSGDPFGAAMRGVLETDEQLAAALGPALPLLARATSVLPGRREATMVEAFVADSTPASGRGSAVARVVHQLLAAPIEARGPGLVAVRPANQRLARGVLWLVPALVPDAAAELLEATGIRFGTSARRDNLARDAALAGTCAALLGAIGDERAVAALSRMTARVRNKPVRAQVAKALAAIADREGSSPEQLVESALPDFGLDADGTRAIGVGDWTALLRLHADGRLETGWRSAGGDIRAGPPRALADARPTDVAAVRRLASEVSAALADERARLDRSFAEERRTPLSTWIARYLEHPVGRSFGRRLIWRLHTPSGALDVLPEPVGDGLVGPDGARVVTPTDAEVVLWHPVDASDAEVEAWRDRIVERRMVQPVKQAFRETYRADAASDAVLDARFADRPMAYGQARALFGARGWSAPLLGPYDLGDRSIASRDFAASGLRAEFSHVPAGQGDHPEGVEFARSGSVRFVSLTVGRGEVAGPLLLARVPSRAFSEALRDVDLFVSVADPTRAPLASRDDATGLLGVRVAVMRRLLPGLPFRRNVSLMGLWLRVEGPDSAYAISLATGALLRLPEETDVELDLVGETEAGPVEAPYVPVPDDPVLARVLRLAAALAGHPDRGARA